MAEIDLGFDVCPVHLEWGWDYLCETAPRILTVPVIRIGRTKVIHPNFSQADAEPLRKYLKWREVSDKACRERVRQ